MLRYFREHGVIRHGMDPKEAAIELGGPIVEGVFVDEERPTFLDLVRAEAQAVAA
jgi:hypothetical protein